MIHYHTPNFRTYVLLYLQSNLSHSLFQNHVVSTKFDVYIFKGLSQCHLLFSVDCKLVLVMNIAEILLTFCIRNIYITSKVYGRHHDLVNRYKSPRLCSVWRNHNPVRFMTYHKGCNNSNTVCTYRSRVPRGFYWGFVLHGRSSVFCVVFCRSLFVHWPFFFRPLCCLSFDIWLLIALLVSTNVSYMKGFTLK